MYLEDMVRAIEKVQTYVGNTSFDVLVDNSMQFEAVLHNLLIIGEGAKHIPEDVRVKYPHVEWRNIGRLRDFVAHEYFGVDLNIVRDVIENKIPQLRHQLMAIMDLET